jgi:hypothetical protein
MDDTSGDVRLGIPALCALSQRAWASCIGALCLVLLVVATSVSILSPAVPSERPIAAPAPTPAMTPTSQASQD